MEVTPPDVSQAPHLPSLLAAHHQHLKCPHLCGDLSKQQQQLLDILSNSLFSDLILSKKIDKYFGGTKNFSTARPFLDQFQD